MNYNVFALDEFKKNTKKLSKKYKNIKLDILELVNQLESDPHNIGVHLFNNCYKIRIPNSSIPTILELERKEIKLEVIEQNFNSKENYSLDELLIFLIDFVKDIKTEKRVIGIKNGKKAGRPQKLTINNVLKAIELKKYQTSAQVADKFKIGRSTLYRYISKINKAS